MSERERKVCQERERASREKQRDAIADVGSGMQRRESGNEKKKKKTGRGLTRRQQHPSRVAASDTGVAAMEVGVQSNIKKRFLVGRGNWLGSV